MIEIVLQQMKRGPLIYECQTGKMTCISNALSRNYTTTEMAENYGTTVVEYIEALQNG